MSSVSTRSGGFDEGAIATRRPESTLPTSESPDLSKSGSDNPEVHILFNFKSHYGFTFLQPFGSALYACLSTSSTSMISLPFCPWLKTRLNAPRLDG